MTEEKLPPAEGDEALVPDTSTDEELEGQAVQEPTPAIPVAEEAPPEPAAEPVLPPAPAGPRVFPQHYTILFGAVMVFVGAISVWERERIFGAVVKGADTITGSFLLAMAIYTALVGVLNIVEGRMMGMLGAFVTGVTALWFGLRALVRTLNRPEFLSFSEISDFTEKKAIPERFAAMPDSFPREALEMLDTRQEQFYSWLGQIAPGVWWTVLGGLLIVLVFFKALFGGGKKKAPAPAPSSRRRGRR